jgi:hypothetical protein
MNTSTQEINMDNVIILILGIVIFVGVLVISELLAIWFDWK